MHQAIVNWNIKGFRQWIIKLTKCSMATNMLVTMPNILKVLSVYMQMLKKIQRTTAHQQ